MGVEYVVYKYLLPSGSYIGNMGNMHSIPTSEIPQFISALKEETNQITDSTNILTDVCEKLVTALLKTEGRFDSQQDRALTILKMMS